jgi:uncharacterized paraquat-inducible protein A
MPWCEPCGRFLNPNTLHSDGSCPVCGTTLAEPKAPAKVPWHFWLLVAAVVLYLGWRAVQGLAWVAERF